MSKKTFLSAAVATGIAVTGADAAMNLDPIGTASPEQHQTHTDETDIVAVDGSTGNSPDLIQSFFGGDSSPEVGEAAGGLIHSDLDDDLLHLFDASDGDIIAIEDMPGYGLDDLSEEDWMILAQTIYAGSGGDAVTRTIRKNTTPSTNINRGTTITGNRTRDALKPQLKNTKKLDTRRKNLRGKALKRD